MEKYEKPQWDWILQSAGEGHWNLEELWCLVPGTKPGHASWQQNMTWARLFYTGLLFKNLLLFLHLPAFSYFYKILSKVSVIAWFSIWYFSTLNYTYFISSMRMYLPCKECTLQVKRDTFTLLQGHWVQRVIRTLHKISDWVGRGLGRELNGEGVEHCTWLARLCTVGLGCMAPEERASFSSAYRGEAVLVLQSAHCIM